VLKGVNRTALYVSILNYLWLNLTDLYITTIMLQLGGREINPLWMGGIGLFEAVMKVMIAKIFVIVVSLAYRKVVREKRRVFQSAILVVVIGLNIFYAFVVVHNFLHLRAQLREVRRVLKV